MTARTYNGNCNGNCNGDGNGYGKGYSDGNGYSDGTKLPINPTDNDELLSSIILAMHGETSALCRASVNHTEVERKEYV